MQRFLICAILILSFTEVHAVQSTPFAQENASLTISEIRHMKNRDIKRKLGRKLSLGETIVFGLIRSKLKRAERRAAKAKGNSKITEAELAGYFASMGYISLLAAAIFTGTTFFLPLALASFIFGTLFGGQGKKRFRDKDERRFKNSKRAFGFSLVPLILGAIFIAVIYGVLLFTAV